MSIRKLDKNESHMSREVNPNVESFEMEEQTANNIVETPHTQAISNIADEKQVCINDLSIC